jgi:hypothetical protein
VGTRRLDGVQPVNVSERVALFAATAALLVQGWRRVDRRIFAGLISIAVTSILFSVVAWTATAIAPLPFTWVLVGTFALLFGLRLYRQLQMPPPDEHHRFANGLSNRAKLTARADVPPVASSAKLARYPA